MFFGVGNYRRLSEMITHIDVMDIDTDGKVSKLHFKDSKSAKDRYSNTSQIQIFSDLLRVAPKGHEAHNQKSRVTSQFCSSCNSLDDSWMLGSLELRTQKKQYPFESFEHSNFFQTEEHKRHKPAGVGGVGV